MNKLSESETSKYVKEKLKLEKNNGDLGREEVIENKNLSIGEKEIRELNQGNDTLIQI